MGEWLIGVYKGKLITATDDEKDKIWKEKESIHKTGLFDTKTERARFRPYFFMLLPTPETETVIVRRNKYIWIDGRMFLKKYGLDSTAYRYGSLYIPAYGSLKKNCFILDERYTKKEHIQLLEECWPDPKEGVCALALKREEWGARTGTFFKFEVKDGKIIFEPCTFDGKYFTGKGILLGVSTDPGMGTMNRREAKAEMSNPISKICTRFGYKLLYGDRKFYIVYREVPTDLRADMPLAMLKVAGVENAFEEMFKNLGTQTKQLIDEKRLRLRGRDILLDGTIVDYADLTDIIDFDDPDNCQIVANEKNELRSILYAAALISATREDGLIALTKGKEALVRLTNKKFDGIYEKYSLFFDHFSLGAGGAIKYFRDLEGEAGLLNFFSPDFS